ncbi:MAG: hypothetical protein JNL62_08345 [Bryobacterales bacterium]|nr:hypothetical protein [Bryobacterales bacterium]
MKDHLCLLFTFVLLAPAQTQLPGPLAAISAEREPEKRYWKALEFATAAVNTARQKYEAGDLEEFRSSLILVEKSVQLSDKTLRSSGKDPAKNPKHFKRAEQRIRDIVKKLAGLEDSVAVEDRSAVRPIRENLQKLQEEMVMDIVGRRR